MSYYDERCGVGTRWGCRRVIGNGERGHVVKHARPMSQSGQRGARSSHALFHPACCPCVVDPEAVQPVSLPAAVAS